MSVYTELAENFVTTSQVAINTTSNVEGRAAWASLAAAQAEAMKAEQMRIANIIALIGNNSNPDINYLVRAALIEDAVDALTLPKDND